MPKETQKAKIQRLEDALAHAEKVILELNDYIIEMQERADESFSNSPYKKQLEDKIKMLEMKLQSSERAKEHAEKMEKAKIDRLQPKHNERGAGRKPKFTDAEVQSMKMYKLQGKSYRAIADLFNCSVGTIHKLINEQ